MNSNWQNVFNWIHVSGALISQDNENIQIDLVPQRIAVSNELPMEINTSVVIKKQLNYDDEVGWSWHKSWNLPEIEYNINWVPNQSQLYKGTLFAQIFVVKALEKQSHYKNLGIKGESKKQIIDQQANFRCLKFTTTSYNNEHKKFHLMIVLFYSPVNGEKVVLSSIISPEIYVDSRKFARFHNIPVHQPSFTELFPYDLLYSIITKRDTKNRSVKMIKIENSIEGFINYFTAPNIRNKIKHPIFLALRFSSLIKLFVDQQIFYQQTNIVTSIQIHLNNIINKVESQKKIKLLIQTQSENNVLQKKAMELIQQLENGCYEIYTQSCYLPNNIVLIEDLQQLLVQYGELFQKSLQSNSKNENSTLIKTQSISQIEDNVVQKVKIEQFPNTPNNNPSLTFREIIPTPKCEFQNSIKKEENLKIQDQIQYNIYQQYNINQSQLYLQSYLNQSYQNYVTLQNQNYLNQYYHPYPYTSPQYVVWKNI
ncbi:unnamed protein product [Paramecium octaurelia]|uniref:Uncharacterized protein n=1 Tax=Paramecium octaurelia TaxID=43137 RepID=A0A8S1S821_PAROT|nr:unnamed protein product [Paramecium octaurelia]